MPPTEFDELLARMPAIAEAVQAFSSEALQSEAFHALMRAYLGTDDSDAEEHSPPGRATPADGLASRPDVDDAAPTKEAAAKKSPAKKAANPKGKQSYSIDKQLDLINGGSQPFKDFASSKNPTSAPEKCLVAVYWLSRMASGSSPVSVEQVYTCFKHSGWQVPADLPNTLQQAGSRGWLDSKKRDDLKVVVGGENHVEHEMPAKTKVD